MKERHFIVFYRALSGNGYTVGHIDMTVKGGYLNKERTFEIINDIDAQFSDTILTNIIEISEHDSRDWRGADLDTSMHTMD